MIPRFVLSIFCLIFIVSSIPVASAKERIALLIGNSDYSHDVGPLKNPGKDVELIASSLEKVGFPKSDITLVKNADRVGILAAITEYSDRLAEAGPDAIGFFYYSGHGAANKRDGKNYLIPVGVKKLDRSLWFKTVALNDIVGQLSRQAPNASHFVVFDACRNHLRLPTKGGKGFVPVSAKRGMLIAFSTDPGQTASDEGNGSGPYAGAPARELTRPGLDHNDLFQNVKERVFQNTGVQVPWERNGLLNRVYLGGRERPDLMAWKSIRDSQDISEFEDYLKRYPSSSYSEAARYRLALLKSQSKPKEEEQPDRPAFTPDYLAWQAVKDTTSSAVLETYINQFPKSLYAGFAKARLSELNQRLQVARLPKALPPQKEDTKTEVGSIPSNLLEPQQTEAKVDPIALTKSLQTELKRVGCDPGSIDGQWGRKGRSALSDFNTHTKLNLPIDQPTQAAIDAVISKKDRVCPKTIQANLKENKIKVETKTNKKSKCKFPSINSCMSHCMAGSGGSTYMSANIQCLTTCQSQGC